MISRISAIVKADAAAAQDFLDQPPVSRPEQTRPAAALGLNQPLVLVKPQGPGRNPELAGQLGDRIVFVQCVSPIRKSG
jgi:hypothetical protein